jgi:thiol-disulfide isomerase/thioredoxin
MNPQVARILQIALMVLATFTTVAAVEAGDRDRYDRLVVDSLIAERGELVDRQATPWELRDLDGNVHTLGSLRGQVVFLNFWASWCAPCRREFPSMMELQQTMDGREFRMVAISQDEDEAALRAFIEEIGVDTDRILVLRDPDGELTRRYGTELLPETYLIDTEGSIVARFANERDWTSDSIRGVIERMAQRRWRAR